METYYWLALSCMFIIKKGCIEFMNIPYDIYNNRIPLLKNSKHKLFLFLFVCLYKLQCLSIR